MNIIGIIGTGLMGTDIAYLSAESGFEVYMFDVDEQQSKHSLELIQDRLNRYARRGIIETSRVGEIISKIKIYKSIKDIAKADIIFECITEDLAAKKSIFSQLDSLCKPGTVLSSNTSSISITEIASATRRPESVIGIHFLNPARVIKLVEIIPGLKTTRETVEMAKDIVKRMGRDFVESRDFPGFLINRMLYPLINESIYLLYEGAASVEAIDKVTTFGLNIPMGPLALADMIGLDIILAIGEQMYKGYADSKYKPCPLLKKYVAAGYLGEKSGRGFYIY